MFRAAFNAHALKGMKPDELQVALSEVKKNIQNLNRGVVPPHLKQRNLQEYRAEQQAIEKEIEQRMSDSPGYTK